MDAAVVLLVGVEFAEVHGLDETWTASEEGFDAAVFHGGNDLTC